MYIDKYFLIFLIKSMTNIKLTVYLKLSNLEFKSNNFVYYNIGYKPFMIIQRDIDRRLQGIETYKLRLV